MPGAVAVLLSAPSFEWFYEETLNISRRTFVDSYRNDWAWEYLAALEMAGLQAHLYVATEGPAERVVVDDGTVIRFLPLGTADLPWRRWPVLRRTPVGRFGWQAANAVALLPALRSALREDHVRALFVQEYWMGRWDVLTRRLDTPVIGVDQGYPERRDVKLFKRRAFAAAAGVITQTGPEADKVRLHGGKPTVLSNAVDTDRFAPGPDSGRVARQIVTVARLADPHKRISDLLRAVAVLPPGWTLELYGDGPDRAMLERLAAELSISDRVTFHGFVMDRARVRQALRTCSVFALPSAFEGLPMSLLEAMASGAAVVGTQIPSIAEVITDDVDGLLVPVGAPEELARAIEQADHEQTRFGHAARDTVLERFSLVNLSARLAQLVA